MERAARAPHGERLKALRFAETGERLHAEARTSSPGEFTRFVRDEYERIARVVKLAGLVPE